MNVNEIITRDAEVIVRHYPARSRSENERVGYRHVACL
jgi:hypothetical protein